jgi:hypothetical protein
MNDLPETGFIRGLGLSVRLHTLKGGGKDMAKMGFAPLSA